MLLRSITAAAVAALGVLVSGCKMAVMDPQGPIGAEEKNIILLATGLMLIVVIPVIAMTLWFAWSYRASNKNADYQPDWEHSNRIEAVVWAVPCLIILALGAVTWVSTHKLDPRRPIASDVKPVEVEVVSLNWKWLFIYPEYGVASVNEMAMPVGRPVHFRLTSDSVMNSFFIPQLGSQIYTMTGMDTQLNLLARNPGTYDGISANYSGEGFASMKFQAVAMNDQGFDAWIARAKTQSATLDHDAYAALSQPSEKTPVAYYGSVDAGLYDHVLMAYADNHDSLKHGDKVVELADKRLCDKPATVRKPSKDDKALTLSIVAAPAARAQ